VYSSTIPLKSGYYSDVGYRNRLNKFHNHKEYFPFAEYVNEMKDDELFYDFTFYNQDTYEISSNSDQSLLCEIYIRLEID